MALHKASETSKMLFYIPFGYFWLLDTGNFYLNALYFKKHQLDFLPASPFMYLWRTPMGECDSMVKTVLY